MRQSVHADSGIDYAAFAFPFLKWGARPRQITAGTDIYIPLGEGVATLAELDRAWNSLPDHGDYSDDVEVRGELEICGYTDDLDLDAVEAALPSDWRTMALDWGEEERVHLLYQGELPVDIDRLKKLGFWVLYSHQ